MKRVVFGIIWTFVLTFVFLFLCAVVAAVVTAVKMRGDPAQNKAVFEITPQAVGLMLLGCLVAAVILSAWGVLPGTRRQPAVTTRPSVPAVTTRLSVPADADVPPIPPAFALPVGTPENPPPELDALGPPLRVHAPGHFASMSGSARLATFFLALFLLVGPGVYIKAVGPDQLPASTGRVLLFGGIGAGLLCLVIAVLPRSPYTYQVHHDALVVYDRKIVRVIPWDHLQVLIPAIPFFKDLTLVTSDGQKVPITNVHGYHQLFDEVFIRVRAHLLPLMVAQAQRGQLVEFGPLAISSNALRYKGAMVPWDEVTSLVILKGSGFRKLTICRGGLGRFWPFCRINLNTLPNDLILLELLKQVLPPRLLMPEDARW